MKKNICLTVAVIFFLGCAPRTYIGTNEEEVVLTEAKVGFYNLSTRSIFKGRLLRVRGYQTNSEGRRESGDGAAILEEYTIGQIEPKKYTAGMLLEYERTYRLEGIWLRNGLEFGKHNSNPIYLYHRDFVLVNRKDHSKIYDWVIGISNSDREGRITAEQIDSEIYDIVFMKVPRSDLRDGKYVEPEND